MKIEVLRQADAPAPPKAMTKSAQEIHAAITRLRDDQVLKEQPDEGKSVRGLKSAFSRVAKGQNVRIESYEIDGDPGVLYVRKRR